MSTLRPFAREIIVKTLAKLSFAQVAEIGKLVTDDLRRKLKEN